MEYWAIIILLIILFESKPHKIRLSPRQKFYFARFSLLCSYVLGVFLALRLDIPELMLISFAIISGVALLAKGMRCPYCDRSFEAMVKADWTNAFVFTDRCDDCGGRLDVPYEGNRESASSDSASERQLLERLSADPVRAGEKLVERGQ